MNAPRASINRQILISPSPSRTNLAKVRPPDAEEGFGEAGRANERLLAGKDSARVHVACRHQVMPCRSPAECAILTQITTIFRCSLGASGNTDGASPVSDSTCRPGTTRVSPACVSPACVSPARVSIDCRLGMAGTSARPPPRYGLGLVTSGVSPILKASRRRILAIA